MASSTRPPIIAVMGHIDHGKSSLLDYIRKTTVVDGEAGGITQHVSAYISEHNGRQVTFLDTPGHEAFKALRSRGASAADIAILVVAADEGIMPQTLDAYEAIKEAGIPFVVAITKIDKNNADIERAKQSLIENAIYLEGLGGDISWAPISSKSGDGVPELLDLVLLTADLVGLSADSSLSARGFVLESTQDSKRGSSGTLIIKDGSLSTGSFVVAGDAFAPVRFIEDFRGTRIASAGPSDPVRISGFSKLPEAGTPFSIASSKKEAEKLVAKHVNISEAVAEPTETKTTELPIVIKTDTAGSIDAIKHELKKIAHERARIRIISSGVGAVSESDVKSAHAASGVVISFNSGVESAARDLAMRDNVAIESFKIIYELSERVSELLIARAPKITIEKELGRAKVLRTFSTSAKKQVLGARVETGIFSVGAKVKILRRDEEMGHGIVTNIQQARADIKEVREDAEFGTEIESKTEAAPHDILVAYTRVES